MSYTTVEQAERAAARKALMANPPAFPNAVHIVTEGRQGMTLLDYFASDAMKGFISNPNVNTGKSYDAVAVESYAMAKAMLKARG